MFVTQCCFIVVRFLLCETVGRSAPVNLDVSAFLLIGNRRCRSPQQSAMYRPAETRMGFLLSSRKGENISNKIHSGESPTESS